MALKNYSSKKIVKADKITAITGTYVPDIGPGYQLDLLNGGNRIVRKSWFDAYQPAVGGYFVQTLDDQSEYIPGVDFESAFVEKP